MEDCNTQALQEKYEHWHDLHKPTNLSPKPTTIYGGLNCLRACVCAD